MLGELGVGWLYTHTCLTLGLAVCLSAPPPSVCRPCVVWLSPMPCMPYALHAQTTGLAPTALADAGPAGPLAREELSFIMLKPDGVHRGLISGD